MTQNDFKDASREELIDLVISKHEQAQQEREQRVALDQQLRWFKRQLFGTKSEKRTVLEAKSTQLSLGELLGHDSSSRPAPATTSVRPHQRTKRSANEQDESPSGLRFDESVTFPRFSYQRL